MSVQLITGRSQGEKRGFAQSHLGGTPELITGRAKPLLFLENELIVIIKGCIVEVDKEDAHFITEHSWHIRPYGTTGYVQRWVPVKKTSTTLHRDIMAPTKGFEVDHINGNGFDNRKSNLRICTRSENSRNRKISKNNRSDFNGVSWKEDHKAWVARIGADRKHIGYFKNPEEAYRAYQMAAKKRFGQFSTTRGRKGK